MMAKRFFVHGSVLSMLMAVTACGGGSANGGATSSTPAPTPMPPPVATLTTNVANWLGSGVLADVWTPANFDLATGTTVILSHGDKSEPNDNYCYGEILANAPYNLRVVLPSYGSTEDAENWRSRRDRWTKQKAIHSAAFAQAGNNASRLVIAGYSFGGYAALLAAGANSDLTGSNAVLPATELDKQAGNCAAGVCAPLAAKGYVIISAQPAQNALNPIASRFWFNATAFGTFTPSTRRYVTFGSNDTSPNDSCMIAASACRGDAYSVQPVGAVQDIVPDFNHLNFACPGSGWTTNAKAADKRALVNRIGAWIVSL
jgi:pimeloyl-ACP methyl ester carboxylesterase